MKIEQRADGLWWPSGAKDVGPKYKRHIADLAVSFKYVKHPGVAIQAGGYIGGWASWLAKRFEAVYTFEPYAPYQQCIAFNAPQENVYAFRGVLSDRSGCVGLHEQSLVSGSHYVDETQGRIPAFTIDALNLPRLDLLVLDVEGFELPALRGAQDMLHKYHPVLHLEDLALGVKKGRGDTFNDILEFLRPFNYQLKERVARDVVLA